MTPTPCSRLLRTVLCSSVARALPLTSTPDPALSRTTQRRTVGLAPPGTRTPPATSHHSSVGSRAAQLDEEPAARVGAGGDGDIGRRRALARRLAAEDQQALHVARLEEDATAGAEPQHRGRRRDGGRRLRLRRRRLVAAHDQDVAPQREALGVLAGVEQQPLARRRALDRRLDRLAGTHDVVELLLLRDVDSQRELSRLRRRQTRPPTGRRT